MTMVSTRGIKYKFCENEKVLCFEPDCRKAKILYDAKVKNINLTSYNKAADFNFFFLIELNTGFGCL